MAKVSYGSETPMAKFHMAETPMAKIHMEWDPNG